MTAPKSPEEIAKEIDSQLDTAPWGRDREKMIKLITEAIASERAKQAELQADFNSMSKYAKGLEDTIIRLQAQRPCLCPSDETRTLVNGHCPKCGGYFVPERIAEMEKIINEAKQLREAMKATITRLEGELAWYRKLEKDATG